MRCGPSFTVSKTGQTTSTNDGHPDRLGERRLRADVIIIEKGDTGALSRQHTAPPRGQAASRVGAKTKRRNLLHLKLLQKEQHTVRRQAPWKSCNFLAIRPGGQAVASAAIYGTGGRDKPRNGAADLCSLGRT